MSDSKRAFGQIDRRGFIVAAGAAAVAVYAPFGGDAVAAPAVGAAAPKALLTDWSIDDQWGVYPRYDAIPSAPRQNDDARLAAVHPADAAFLA
ncbi:MAG TPA: hypothetical protein VE907_23795 [Gammaproteobacteria bacterium]|nr:hypothetical protein [Gammaproteobacteria bacterium]